MLYYDRIHDPEGDDVNKTSASKECDVCRYQYFLNYSFKFQPNFCNKCYDLLMMSVNRSDIAISNIKGSGYYYQFNQPKKKIIIIILFRIKSVLMSKKNLIASLCITKKVI